MTTREYTPGQGCACALCRQPLPNPAPVGPAEAARRNDQYLASRGIHRAAHPHKPREN